MSGWRSLAFLLLFLSLPAAADSMRCGTKLVVDGDTKGEVRAKCGQPDEQEVSTALRRPLIWVHGRPVYVGDALIEVRIEYWTYNFGPRKFMRRLKFVDGKLEQIETLGYGYL